MRRALMLCGLGLALVLAALWVSGGFDALVAWIGQAERGTQDRLTVAVRALKAGQPGAVGGLLVACFVYGVLHALGPGHGKALIGGYGVARRVPVVRLSVLALVSALAQAAVAVALVYGAVAVLGLTRQAVEGAAEGWVPAIGNLMVAGLGLWLVLRGVQRMRLPAEDDHDHDHGPTVQQVEALAGWRDTAALVAGIAMRPCSGALFVLILTWQLGIGAAGVAGAFVMGLGVAAVTVAVAVMAVWAREGALATLPGGRIARMLPVIEAIAGGVILVVALVLLARGL